MKARPRQGSRLARALAFVLPCLVACAPWRPSTEARLAGVGQAIGATGSGASRYLRYAIESEAGAWTREIVITADAYAERRVRADGGARYAFGQDARGTWLRVGDGAVIDATGGVWEQEARTYAGLYGLRFTRPAPQDEAEYMGRSRQAWELAYRPAGGRTLTFSIDRFSQEPRAYDLIDDFGRLVSCDDLDWSRDTAGPLLAGFRCNTNDRFGTAGVVLSERHALEAERALDLEGPPAWAAPGSERVSAPPLVRPAELRIKDSRRIVLPVRFGDRAPADMILDTGAFFTILSEKKAEELGVVPTGETRLHVDPPWLRRSHLRVGVVEHLRIGAAELWGERVLVADDQDFGDAVGLLGRSTLRRFVLDVDSPAGAVRLASHRSWKPDRGQTSLLYLRDGIDGSIPEVARGTIVLDTGMEQDIVVYAPEMSMVHRRERGSDVVLGGADSTRSADYRSSIDGLLFGPFPFPKMDAIGRDRDRGKVGEGIAIAGMGLMHYFRLAFDIRNSMVHAWPGDAYRTLRRAWMDVEEGAGGPTISRIVPGGPAEEAGLKEGDLVVGVSNEARLHPDLPAVLRAIGRSPVREVHVWVRRRGLLRAVGMMLEDPEDS